MNIWSAQSTEHIAPLGKGYAIGRFLDKLSHLTLLARTYFYGHFVQTLIVGVEWWCVQGDWSSFQPLSDQQSRVGDLELVLFLFVPLALCCFKWLLLSGFRNTSSLPVLFLSQNEWAVTEISLSFFAGVRVTSISDYEVLSGSKACVKHQYWQQDYCGLSWLLTCRPLKTL